MKDRVRQILGFSAILGLLPLLMPQQQGYGFSIIMVKQITENLDWSNSIYGFTVGMYLAYNFILVIGSAMVLYSFVFNQKNILKYGSLITGVLVMISSVSFYIASGITDYDSFISGIIVINPVFYISAIYIVGYILLTDLIDWEKLVISVLFLFNFKFLSFILCSFLYERFNDTQLSTLLTNIKNEQWKLIFLFASIIIPIGYYIYVNVIQIKAQSEQQTEAE